MDYETWGKISEDEYGMFERISEVDRPSSHPDVCAFIYLEKKFGPNLGTDIISAAEHDIYYLNYSSEAISQLTDADTLYLCRCGCFWDEECGGSLAFFT